MARAKGKYPRVPRQSRVATFTGGFIEAIRIDACAFAYGPAYARKLQVRCMILYKIRYHNTSEVRTVVIIEIFVSTVKL